MSKFLGIVQLTPVPVSVSVSVLDFRLAIAIKDMRS
jgi:hypothetical protein